MGVESAPNQGLDFTAPACQGGIPFPVSRFTFPVSRFTLHASRFTLHVSRFTFHNEFAFTNSTTSCRYPKARQVTVSAPP